MNNPTLPLPYAADLELLQMATSTLMTRFYEQPCPGIVRAVVRHLEEVVNHPRIQASLAAHEGYTALLGQWNGVLERSREELARRKADSGQAHSRPVIH